MGKVLSKFLNGFPGTVSRSIDNVIISLRNASGEAIPFGAPVFLVSGSKACTVFDASTSTGAAFLGFAVRAGDKTPDTYGSNAGSFAPDDPVDILVRGSIVLPFGNAAQPGSPVYIRKADGALVTQAGQEGTTVALPNVTVRTARDADRRAEVVVLKRNIM